MAKQEYSSHQKGIIQRYYDNKDTIALQNLQELVTELYLADSDKKKEKLWERAHKAMVKLKVPQQIMDHILAKGSVEILAKNVAEWVGKGKK